VQRAATVLLLVLVAVPLLFSGHHHAAQEMQTQQCAVCTLVRHAPTVVTVVLASVAPTVCDRVVEPARHVPGACLHRLPQAGRAPPSRTLELDA